jgi:hypothetical protein
MSKKEATMIVILLLISLNLFFLINDSTAKKEAYVYYDGEIVRTINMNSMYNDTFVIDGLLGEVTIEYNYGKIRVIDETSEKNLCSKQGYISNIGEAIVCLPNLVVIEIKTSEIDGVIR